MSSGGEKEVASKVVDEEEKSELNKNQSEMSLEEKAEDKSFPSEASTEVLVNESDNSITPENLEKTGDEVLQVSKDNESSMKLEMETTPEVVTKIPESQDLYMEESIVERSHPSTIEIGSIETASKETLSFSECEGNKDTPQLSSRKGQEEEHSLHISQDDLFGSHTGVVASTPQSDFNSRILLQKKAIKNEIEDDVEVIPSSPEEKRSKTAVLPLKRELSIGRTSLRKEPSSSPDVMEIPEEVVLDTPEKEEASGKKQDLETNTAGKRKIDFSSVECQGLESQETICSGYVEKIQETTRKESSETSPVEGLKETKSTESTDISSTECGQKFDDDFDTLPVAAVDQYPLRDDSQDLERETQDSLSGGTPNENDSKRPKCGLKRKIEDIKLITPKDLILGKRDSSDEDVEVEVLEVKKQRKSVEVVYSKPILSRTSLRYKSPSKLSSSYSSSSSSSISSPKKPYISLKRSFDGTKTVKVMSESEDLVEEDFTLHMSPTGSQLDIKIDSPAKLPSENDGKICGTMSTIMEVDEASTSVNESSLIKATRDLDFKDNEENMSITKKDDKIASEEKARKRVAAPPSPEYLPEDNEGVLTGLLEENDNDVEIEKSVTKGGKLGSMENCSNGHLSDHSKDSPSEDTTLKEIKTITPEDNVQQKENKDKREGDGDQCHKTAELQRWLYVHVSQKYDVETGEILSTKVLEMQCPEESIKHISKEKLCGRISDVSKASSIDSKSSACLGDVSSPPNAASPQSISGDAKLFSLPPTRVSIMSAFSHSSSSTSGSDLVINIKGKDKATFTKPSNPPTLTKDKGLNLDNLSPELKALMSKESDATKEISKQHSKMPESVLLDLEQAIQRQAPNIKDLTSKQDIEEKSEGVPMMRRLMKKTPKGKRLPLRLKKKSSNSNKPVSPLINSPESSKNTEEMDTVPVESLDESSSPQTPKVTNFPLRLTPLSSRTKSNRSRSRQLSQKESSENSSEFGSSAKSSKNSQEATKEEELSCTPNSLKATSGHVGMVTEGALVFAKFSDKWYYPGKARQQLKDDRWIIDFDDGNVKWVKEEFIVVVEVLQEGQSVFAAVGDDGSEYEPGMITKVEIINNQPLYTIDLDVGHTVVFPNSKLCLTEDLVKLVTESRMEPIPSTPKRKAEVSLDNVLEGRRTRGRKTIESAGPSTPCASKSQTGPRSLPPSVVYSTSYSSEMSESDIGLEDIPGVEVPDSPESSSTPSCKSKGPGRKKGKSKQVEEMKEEIVEKCKLTPAASKSNELGPIPSKGSSLFKGKYFILNIGATKEVTMRKTRNRAMRSDASSDGDGSESCEEMQFSITPFVKKQLKKQIEAGGGIVLDHYDSRCKGSNSFLISNRCNLTADYILCLAADIQSVSHDWVINCCIKGEAIPWMENLLPVGWSQEDKRYIEWHERCSRSLKGVEVVLASDSGNKFLEFWRRVLTTAGASVRKVSTKTMSPYEDISYVRVVVADHKCPEGILVRANEAGIPMVSTYWVQQCLIHGKMRPFNAHPSYKYDYVHSD